jgi:hypothetical protein
VRRTAPQGLLARGHRLQGFRLLPDRQPQQRLVEFAVVLVLVEVGERLVVRRLVEFFVFLVFRVEVGRRLVGLVRQFVLE